MQCILGALAFRLDLGEIGPGGLDQLFHLDERAAIEVRARRLQARLDRADRLVRLGASPAAAAD